MEQKDIRNVWGYTYVFTVKTEKTTNIFRNVIAT